jgi:hypothetical protein
MITVTSHEPTVPFKEDTKARPPGPHALNTAIGVPGTRLAGVGRSPTYPPPRPLKPPPFSDFKTATSTALDTNLVHSILAEPQVSHDIEGATEDDAWHGPVTDRMRRRPVHTCNTPPFPLSSRWSKSRPVGRRSTLPTPHTARRG